MRMMQTMPTVKFLLCFYLLALPVSYAEITFPNTTSTNTTESLNIKALVLDFLKEKVSIPANGKVAITVANIDPRVIIKPCQKALVLNIPEKDIGRNVNVKITCDDSVSWFMYLPAKITKLFPVIVTRNSIAKGTTLTNDNISIQYLPENKIRGVKLTDINSVLGSKAKKRIGKGRAINKKNICLVCKGDAVTIIAKSSKFMIKTQGIALSSGTINQQIKVKNKRSGNIITPKVTAINQVTINL